MAIHDRSWRLHTAFVGEPRETLCLSRNASANSCTESQVSY
jgi:hypothetical protein